MEDTLNQVVQTDLRFKYGSVHGFNASGQACNPLEFPPTRAAVPIAALRGGGGWIPPISLTVAAKIVRTICDDLLTEEHRLSESYLLCSLNRYSGPVVNRLIVHKL